MFCSKCGKESFNSFCPDCGEPMQPAPVAPVNPAEASPYAVAVHPVPAAPVQAPPAKKRVPVLLIGAGAFVLLVLIGVLIFVVIRGGASSTYVGIDDVTRFGGMTLDEVSSVASDPINDPTDTTFYSSDGKEHPAKEYWFNYDGDIRCFTFFEGKVVELWFSDSTFHSQKADVILTALRLTALPTMTESHSGGFITLTGVTKEISEITVMKSGKESHFNITYQN